MEKFEVKIINQNISSDDLIDDLKSIYKDSQNKRAKFSKRYYNKKGKFHSQTIASRFGSWNKALAEAKIPITQERDIQNEKLFENLKAVWIFLGRQPTYRDMLNKPSKYHPTTYSARFGSWNKALIMFSDFINSDIDEPGKNSQLSEIISDSEDQRQSKIKKRTNREISEKLRFSILLRDGFKCQSCGRSPVTSPGVELHVDHIIPWSKGGETVKENLQTKCKECNLGKGNSFNV